MDSVPFLIAGLGNPGAEYTDTPHNIGFELVDLLAKRWQCPTFKKKFDGLYTENEVMRRKVLLLKPQTYMNLSGKSVAGFVGFFKMTLSQDLLVVTDDIDLPPGQLRLRKSGGTGGHNGLRSVTDALGSDGFPRLRIGVGRSPGMDPSDHVLNRIPASQKATYTIALDRAMEGVELLLKQGIDQAMNQVNTKADSNGT